VANLEKTVEVHISLPEGKQSHNRKVSNKHSILKMWQNIIFKNGSNKPKFCTQRNEQKIKFYECLPPFSSGPFAFKSAI
jgi:hypothetical protein